MSEIKITESFPGAKILQEKNMNTLKFNLEIYF